MLLGEVEETIYNVEVDATTSEQRIRVRLIGFFDYSGTLRPRTDNQA